MPPIPPIAPALGEEETTGAESTAVKVSIRCAATDCKFNSGGKCTKPEINVSAGPAVSCESYEPTGGGAESEAAGGGMPPLPPMPMGMGMGM